MFLRLGFWFLIALVLLQQCAIVWAKEAQIEFKVVPNKAGKIEIALDTPPIESSTCRFEWDSTGATVEQWVAKIEGDPRSGELECEVTRKGGAETYLMFTKFKTTLGTNPILEAVVHHNDGEMESDSFKTEDEASGLELGKVTDCYIEVRQNVGTTRHDGVWEVALAKRGKGWELLTIDKLRWMIRG